MDTLLEIRRPIEDSFQEFERLFDESLKSDNPLLGNVLSYVAAKRGKQLRPILVLLSAQMCNKITDKTLCTAVALELLHTASRCSGRLANAARC